MDDKNIKDELSKSLASDLHELWRAARNYEPKIKKSKDESWNEIYGTDQVDIAGCTFEELPSNLKYENLEAAKVAIELVYDKVIHGEIITSEVLEQMGAKVHEAWLKRNSWVYHKEYGDSRLAVSYEQLSIEEQNKDKLQIKLAQLKVKEYIDGLSNVKTI